MNIYTVIVALSWLAFIVFWIVSAFGAKKSVRTSYARGIAWRLVLWLLVVWFISSGAYKHFNWQWTTHALGQPWIALGALFAVLGVGFAIWARVYLGRNWGMPMTLRESPELVTTGPYHYVRNPIYTGVLLAMLGSALTINLVWLALCIIGGAYFVYSAIEEQKEMARLFPETYPAYRARTRMLVPFIF